MTESKGKFILMASSLFITLKPEAKTIVESEIQQHTGKALTEIEPEGWYRTEVLEAVLQTVERYYGSSMGEIAIKIIGRRVYPTIVKTVGLPEDLCTPLDWLKWENEGFLANHRGNGVIPRKFMSAMPGHAVIEAFSPGYNCLLTEGVYEGLLHMCHTTSYCVKQLRCVKKGDPLCEFDINWEM